MLGIKSKTQAEVKTRIRWKSKMSKWCQNGLNIFLGCTTQCFWEQWV